MRKISTNGQDPEQDMRGVELAAARQRDREKRMYPLRINRQITLLVPKSKCNDKYAQWYRENILAYGK